MKRFGIIGWLMVLMVACAKPPTTDRMASPELARIDTLMQIQPDSALTLLLDEPTNEPYYQLLLSEALYKNDYAQTNRDELLEAMAYFDSVQDPFLSARCHYMNGVGYYEMDSVVPACEEYMKAIQIMEEHYPEKELVGLKAKFMALTYTRLCVLFSDLYMHEQAICFGKRSLDYYDKYNASDRHVAWMLDEIGSQYEMLNSFDSAVVYFQKGEEILSDTNNITYRDLKTHLAYNSFQEGAFSVALENLFLLSKQAESEKEYLSRCLIVGEIYYNMAQYDSALFYLTRVYEQSRSVASKKQAAEWLVEICDKHENHFETKEYVRFLSPFANENESQGYLKSKLAKLCINFERKKDDSIHRQLLRKINKTVGFVVICLLLFLAVCGILIFFNKHKQQLLLSKIDSAEQLIKNERQAHFIQQTALGGRLKQKNLELKKLLSEKKQESFTEPNKQIIDGGFTDEMICKHILKVCNDEHNPIKSNVPVSAYAEIALDNKQKTQLKQAALKHYGELFLKLKKQYPALKEKDLLYCYLSLLDLNNVQIAVLLQNTISTIWNRERRLKEIFGKDESILSILNWFLID